MAKTNKSSDLDLVGKIYDAALDPYLWHAFLEDCAGRLNAASGVMSFHNTLSKELRFVEYHARDDDYFKQYANYFVTLNPYLDLLTGEGASLYTTHTLLPEKTLEQTEFYHDWLKPQGVHYQAGAVAFRDSARIALVDFERPKAQQPFGEQETTLLATLEPHLKRALQMNQRFWDHLAQPSAAVSVLDHLEFGVMLLDEHAKPVYMNQQAEFLSRQSHAMVVNKHELVATDPEERRTLERLIGEAVETGRGLGAKSGGVINLGRFSDFPLYLLVAPMRTERNDLGLSAHRVCCAVFITSPNREVAASVESIREMFGITNAEANLVWELANGNTLEDIAVKFGISKNTARDQLKSVFSKTGQRRQVDVARLVLSSPTALVGESLLLGKSVGGPMERRQVADRRLLPRKIPA